MPPARPGAGVAGDSGSVCVCLRVVMVTAGDGPSQGEDEGLGEGRRVKEGKVWIWSAASYDKV